MNESSLIKKHLKTLKRIQNVSFDRSKFLRLDKNENVIPFPKKIIRNFIKKIDSNFISTYPEFSFLYKRIAKWVGCKKENIYVTAGSDAAIKSVFEVFVRPKDKVLILHPTYGMYYVYTHMFEGILLKIEYKNDLSISEEQMISWIKKKRPRLICIANPNSPTGTIINPKSLEKIIKIAYEYSSIILIDEAYYLYYPKTAVHFIDRYPNLIVTRSFSKAFGLASLRLGIAVAHEAMIKNILKVRPMYESNAFAALIGKAVLDNYNLVKVNTKKALEGKAYLESKLDKLDIRYFKSFANFVVIDVGSHQKSCKIVKEMKRHKILIAGAFKHPCLYSSIRVTIGPKAYMKRFLGFLQELI